MYASSYENNKPPFSQTAFDVDWMTLDDLSEVVEIEEISGLNRWGYDSYRRELITNPRAIMLVARTVQENERNILGFFAGWTVEDEMHINNIASHPDFRRIGVGFKLLETALEQGGRRGISQVILEVRASNETAQSLYRKFGFKYVNRRRDYYRFPTEDAFVMKLDLYT
jgi:ribosomal-protein-alanine N-acetyltransferase